jgi:predicted small lipoprotein YifL
LPIAKETDMRLNAFTLILALSLSACGQTGPLYHPNQEQPPAPSDAELETTERTQVQVR